MNKNNIEKQAIAKAQKYYGTSDLSTLAPYQLDKIMGWIMWGEDAGKSKSHKAQQALRQNKKYQGKHTKAFTNNT